MRLVTIACALCATLAVLPLAPRLAAQGMEPIDLGSPLAKGWIPDHIPVLRGTLVMNGEQISPRWRECAASWHYAIIRINTDGYGGGEDRPRGEVMASVVIHSVAELARRTGHPELNTAPFISIGYSRYSPSMSRGMYEQFPDRLVAFATGNSPGRRQPERGAPGTWTVCPSIVLATEFEDTYGIGDSLQVERMTDRPWGRFDGLLQAMSLTRGTRHDPFNHHEFTAIFFSEVIKARVPADWDPRSGAPTLLPIAQADGWLGDQDVFRYVEREITADQELVPTIAPFGEYPGDKSFASWLPTEATAYVWRAFSMGRPLATVIGPSHIGLPKGKSRQVLHLEHNLRDQVPFTVIARCETDDIVQMDVFANHHELGSITEFSGGEMATGSTTGATGSVAVTLPAGVYGLMVRYTRASGRVGWSRPALITVFPNDL